MVGGGRAGVVTREATTVPSGPWGPDHRLLPVNPRHGTESFSIRGSERSHLMKRRRQLRRDAFKVVLVLGWLAVSRLAAGEIAEWTRGLPPSAIAERMALAEPEHARLSHGSEFSDVWVVRGMRAGERRAAVIAKLRDGTLRVGIRELSVTASRALEELRIPVALEGSRVAVLGVGLLESGQLRYQWRGNESVGSLSFGAEIPHLVGTPVADSATWDTAVLRGSVVVLTWWSTSCIPCVEEHPALDALARELAGEAAVRFIAISPESRGVLAAMRQRATRNP